MKRRIPFLLIGLCTLMIMGQGSYAVEISDEFAPRYNTHVSAQLHDEFLLQYDDSEYGGAYIGDDGQLVINLVETEDNARQMEYITQKNESLVTSALKKTDRSVIETKTVRYSMAYLKNVVDKVTPYLSEFNLLGVGIDEKNNCVVIDAGRDSALPIADNMAKSKVISLLKADGVDAASDVLTINRTNLVEK